MRLNFLILLILFSIVDNCGSAQISDTYDSGFRAEVNGFSFQNYGDETPTIGITPSEMQRMFGENVCFGTAEGKCILSPPARVWMELANKAMNYFGHCEGMAVLSILMYSNQTAPTNFGGSEADKLSLENELLQREIAYWWATQVTTPGRSRKVDESANVVLDTLINTFKNGRQATEWWTLGIYQPDGNGGHAITPCAVENLSNGSARILVYDNNFPKITRSVEIDRITNTWKYHTSINPDEPSELYAGNASTKNLEVVSVPPRLGLQNCEFCDDITNSGLGNTKGALAGQSRIQFWVNGSAKLLVTDANGMRTGYLDSGQFINEIPSAEAIRLKFLGNPGLIEYEPVLNVPAGEEIKAQLTGSGQPSNSDWAGIGSYYYFRVQGQDLKPGEKIDVTTSTNGNEYTIQFSAPNFISPKTVLFTLGIRTPTRSYEFAIKEAKFDPSGSFVFHYHYDPDQLTNIFTSETIGNADPGLFNCEITVTDGMQQIIANNDITQKMGSKITLYLDQIEGDSIVADVQNGDIITKTTLYDNPGLHPDGQANPTGIETGDGSTSPGLSTGEIPPLISPTLTPSDYKLVVYVNH